MWADTKQVTVKVMLITSIFGPLIMSGEFLYFRVIEPAQRAANAATPQVPDIIITIQPTPPAETKIETETIVPEIPPAQRRTSGKHRAPEPTTVMPVPPAPGTTSSTPVAPRQTRSVAPAEPAPSGSSARPVPPASSAPVPQTTPSAPAPSSGSSATPVPPRPSTLSSTPIYDTLRRETMAADPSMPESAIPR